MKIKLTKTINGVTDLKGNINIYRNNQNCIQIGNLEFKDMNNYDFYLIEAEEHLDFLLDIFSEIKNENDRELIKDDIKKLFQNNEKGVFVLVSNNTNEILCYDGYNENDLNNNEFIIELEEIINKKIKE